MKDKITITANNVQSIIFDTAFAKTILDNVWPTGHVFIYIQHPLYSKGFHNGHFKVYWD